MNDTKKPDYCPEWFDLDNYKGLSKISRSKWKFLIDRKMFYFLSIDDEYNQGVIYDEDMQNFRLKYAVFSTKKIIENELDIEIEPIISMRCLHEKVKGLFMEGSEELEEAKAYISNCQDIQYQINTRYSDDAIIEALKKELTRIRQQEQNNSGKCYSDSYIQSLIADNVVPYIDLILWQNITRDYLTDAQIANLIFPGEYDIDVVNKIRKTVKVKALELLSPNGRKFI